MLRPLHTLAILAVPVAAVMSVHAPAMAASGGSPASGWHIGYYTPSVHGALSEAQAASVPGSVASLDFTSSPNTALLTTDQKKTGLLGDNTGKSVSASFTISNLTGLFTYYGEVSCGNPTSSVRYFFQTSNSGGFDETHYWWSNPVHADLITNGPTTLPTVAFDGANWTDYYGHRGTDPAYSAGFNSAVSNVTAIGVSFGGGCFFENGVGTSDGSGTFTLNTFTVN